MKKILYNKNTNSDKVHALDGKTVWRINTGQTMPLHSRRRNMGYVHCCSGLRKCKTFSVKPYDNYIFCELDYLESCPICGNTVLQLTRLNNNNEISVYRLKNKKAKKFFEKIKSSIISENHYNYSALSRSQGRFYLYYNEYGVKKKCFSNLSTMTLGKL